MELHTRTVTANGIHFHCLEAGHGPLVLCLHGFPDNAYTYRSLLPALAEAGFHAVAPFMRGYAPRPLQRTDAMNLSCSPRMPSL